MKNLYITLSIYACFMALFACSNDDPNPEVGKANPQSITALRRIDISKDVVFESTQIKGVVVSDQAAGNIGNNLIAVQEEGRDAAILIALEDDASSYETGDEVTISLEGAGLVSQDEELVLTNLSSARVAKTGNKVNIAAKTTSLSTIVTEAKYWGPLLVKVESVNIVNAEGQKLKGDFNLNDGVGSIKSRVLQSADFYEVDAPSEVGAFTGLVRVQNNDIFLNLRTIDDLEVELSELLEDFEDVTNTNYDVKVLEFRTGMWTIDGGITASTSADLKNGNQSIRLQGTIGNDLRNGIVAMEFDLKGVKTIKVSHGIYPAAAEVANINATTFDVEISRDGGESYSLLQRVTINVQAENLLTEEIEVNAGANEEVRFRFVNSSTPFANNNRPRISLDDVIFIL